MALGRRKDERQEEMWVSTTDLPKSDGHIFYVKLNKLLAKAGFDEFVEKLCRSHYHKKMGRPGIPPGVYFRMLLVGYFEGIGSQRGIAWRCADSLSLRSFLGIPLSEGTPDHSSLTRVRDRLPLEVHSAVFQFVLQVVDGPGLLKGKTVAVDATTLEEKNGYLPETRSAVKQLVASPDGRWVAVLYRNETLWLLDNENPEQIKKAPFEGQGTISCVRFEKQNRIWVANHIDRATLYDLESKKQLKNYEPESNWFAFAYRYAVGPLYKVFPKPGELYKVVTYLSSTGDTKYNRDVDLALGSETPDPFGPLWSGLGFMGLILCLSCMLFHFKDF